jgi:hypothetical protein
VAPVNAVVVVPADPPWLTVPVILAPSAFNVKVQGANATSSALHVPVRPSWPVTLTNTAKNNPTNRDALFIPTPFR